MAVMMMKIETKTRRDGALRNGVDDFSNGLTPLVQATSFHSYQV